MNAAARIGGFAAAVAVVFAAALGVGSAVGGGEAVAPADHVTDSHAEGDAGHDDAGHGDAPAPAAPAELPGGLLVSDRGYTLDVDADVLPAGPRAPVSFRVLGPDGQPVTDFDVAHDERLHLIAVRRDLSGYQHVHPELDGDGTWTVPLALTPGTWRLFADVTPTALGENVVLGVDVPVPGQHRPRELPAASTSTTVDGYTVSLDGELVPGEETELTLSVTRDGEPVRDLEPYLSAYGHLVALRAGDLAYLHVHPAGEPGDGRTEPGPEVTFYATAPSAGDYRLFLDFQHDGVVRTAPLTVRAETPKGRS